MSDLKEAIPTKGILHQSIDCLAETTVHTHDLIDGLERVLLRITPVETSDKKISSLVHKEPTTLIEKTVLINDIAMNQNEKLKYLISRLEKVV